MTIQISKKDSEYLYWLLKMEAANCQALDKEDKKKYYNQQKNLKFKYGIYKYNKINNKKRKF